MPGLPLQILQGKQPQIFNPEVHEDVIAQELYIFIDNIPVRNWISETKMLDSRTLKAVIQQPRLLMKVVVQHFLEPEFLKPAAGRYPIDHLGVLILCFGVGKSRMICEPIGLTPASAKRVLAHTLNVVLGTSDPHRIDKPENFISRNNAYSTDEDPQAPRTRVCRSWPCWKAQKASWWTRYGWWTTSSPNESRQVSSRLLWKSGHAVFPQATKSILEASDQSG